MGADRRRHAEHVMGTVVSFDVPARAGEPRGDGPLGRCGEFVDHVVDDAAGAGAVVDPERAGARAGAAGVRAHQSGAEFGRYLGHRGIIAAPAVVDQVRARRAGQPGHLGAPGVDADQLVGVGVAQPFDERHDAVDFGGGVDGLPRACFDAADVDHVGALGDQAVHVGFGFVVGEVGAAVIERVRGAVDDRHDQRTVGADLATAQCGLHTSIVPAAFPKRSPASSVACPRRLSVFVL